MFDDAADALEEIDPEDKTRKEILGARVQLYLAAKNGNDDRGGKSSSEGGAPGGRLVDQSGLCDAVM